MAESRKRSWQVETVQHEECLDGRTIVQIKQDELDAVAECVRLRREIEKLRERVCHNAASRGLTSFGGARPFTGAGASGEADVDGGPLAETFLLRRFARWLT